ncbi:hypothetical protein ABNN70_01850 [Sporolactobacillus sp. Y61]|jgi:hypothetical protein|uniref:DUF2178 domain-containing protein n=1 Tax=Sporolactobacillus sp. Y61 TaxID=3160863 RepID=A0AAU8IGH2_9BACL|nr:hypothetical protein [Sporolactobacillus sp. THM19-2]RYL92667.1 hypothetical protein EWH91_07355 [Sporolactobacillus sp. THM19-2]
MKRLTVSYILCLTGIVLFALALVPLVSANEQFARIIESAASEWTISINMLFWIPLLIYSVVVTCLLFKNKKKERLSFWLYPLILPSADERETAINAAACRRAFAVLWLIAPVCAGLMCFYPLFDDYFPAYPILIIMLIPLVQISVYFSVLRKIYQNDESRDLQ